MWVMGHSDESSHQINTFNSCARNCTLQQKYTHSKRVIITWNYWIGTESVIWFEIEHSDRRERVRILFSYWALSKLFIKHALNLWWLYLGSWYMLKIDNSILLCFYELTLFSLELHREMFSDWCNNTGHISSQLYLWKFILVFVQFIESIFIRSCWLQTEPEVLDRSNYWILKHKKWNEKNRANFFLLFICIEVPNLGAFSMIYHLWLYDSYASFIY